MSDDLIIRRLGPDDVQTFLDLRREALVGSPEAFSSSPEDDSRSDEELVREMLAGGGEAIVFGAFLGELAIGCAGLVHHARRAMEAHRAGIWGMYVQPAHRRRGAGERLLNECIEHARRLGLSQVHLSVTERASAARRLYERAGFFAWGREPSALQVDGEFVDEDHMVLELTVG